ncbi:TetR/AcrR family transcriptional regulator [Martelella sp. HB161492]|uniref:TetR/AcrR family transcriptional regulator n=1 Tax=Martelella sp. HB161492 TaxID=2720726 RepID=UPI00158FF7C0|nr:TetR/AcrR family transcriptional regulator [Martelella sp. HB161492]
MILEAALTVFAEKGFASARIEDIARAAGLGKGTIYLYFSDKQALFMGLVAELMTPLITNGEQLLAHEEFTARDILASVYQTFSVEVLATRKADLLRLVITEMGNFPELAAYYHNNLIRPGLDLLGVLLERAKARGELRSTIVMRAPQVIFAPLVMTVVWNTLFQRFGRFDSEAAFQFFLDSLFHPAEGAEQ